MEKPLWVPGQDRIDRANLSRFMRFVRQETGNADLNSYAPLYRFSIEQPAAFWTMLWDFVGIRASGDRHCVLADGESMLGARWFPEVSLNFAQNLLRFDDERIAIRCHDVDGEHESLSYAQLQRRVAALAAALRSRGVVAGDCVAAVLPNVPDAMVAMLASASLGAVWFAVPGDCSFAHARLLFEPLQPKVLFVAEHACIDDDALASAEWLVSVSGYRPALPMPERVVPLAKFTASFADADLEFAPVAFAHPLYFTRAALSGGAQETLMHGTGGTLIQHLKELVLHVDLKREDKIFFHAGNNSMAWYWLASSLAIGATLVLHAGADFPADQAALWDLVDDYGITVLGVHSHWLDAAAHAGLRPVQSHRLQTLKTILVAGAALPAAAYDYVYRDIKERVFLAPLSTGGDTLACFALGSPLLPVWRGEIPCRGLGMKVEVIDAFGEPTVGTFGELACGAPFPSMPLGFWNDADKFRFTEAYLSRQPGRWCAGETALLTERESLVLAGSDESRLGERRDAERA